MGDGVVCVSPPRRAIHPSMPNVRLMLVPAPGSLYRALYIPNCSTMGPDDTSGSLDLLQCLEASPSQTVLCEVESKGSATPLPCLPMAFVCLPDSCVTFCPRTQRLQLRIDHLNDLVLEQVVFVGQAKEDKWPGQQDIMRLSWVYCAYLAARFTFGPTRETPGVAEILASCQSEVGRILRRMPATERAQQLLSTSINRQNTLGHWLSGLVFPGHAREEHYAMEKRPETYRNQTQLNDQGTITRPPVAPADDYALTPQQRYTHQVVGFYWALQSSLRLSLVAGVHSQGDEWDHHVLRVWQVLRHTPVWHLHMQLWRNWLCAASDESEEEAALGHHQAAVLIQQTVREAAGRSAPEPAESIRDFSMDMGSLALLPPRFWHDPEGVWGVPDDRVADTMADPLLCGLLAMSLDAPPAALTTPHTLLSFRNDDFQESFSTCLQLAEQDLPAALVHRSHTQLKRRRIGRPMATDEWLLLLLTRWAGWVHDHRDFIRPLYRLATRPETPTPATPAPPPSLSSSAAAAPSVAAVAASGHEDEDMA